MRQLMVSTCPRRGPGRIICYLSSIPGSSWDNGALSGRSWSHGKAPGARHLKGPRRRARNTLVSPFLPFSYFSLVPPATGTSWETDNRMRPPPHWDTGSRAENGGGRDLSADRQQASPDPQPAFARQLTQKGQRAGFHYRKSSGSCW